MKEMKLSKGLTVLLTLAIILTSSAAVMAENFQPILQRRGMKSEFIGLKTFLELKLSDSQQAEMMNIINKYQNERENLKNGIRQARKNVLTVLHSEQFNEEDARKTFREASAVKEEIFVSRAKMMTELKTVLTPDQLELLKESKAKRFERVKQRFDDRLENLSE